MCDVADQVSMKLDENDKQKSKDEYTVLLAFFDRLLELAKDSAEYWETIEDIITHRAASLIERVLDGLSLDFDRALDILRSKNDFTTQQERDQRDILVAAIDNLVDFAVAEEFSMLDELGVSEEIDDEEVFEKYNLTYASQENSEVLYAAGIAAWWLLIPVETLITFMTQGDERVRDWHLSLEGLSYRKSEFPVELIPPIEWGCRCFLVSDSFDSVIGSLNIGDYKKHLNPVFCESLAKGGKIFSSHHRYFQKPLPQAFEKIAIRIKAKFYDKANN